MELDKYIEKKVLFNLQPEFVKANESLFQNAARSPYVYGKIVAVDEVGVWVENPTWKTQPVGSEKFMTHRMHFLIMWSNILSIGVFPNRKFSGEEEREEKNIGRIGF